MDLWLPSKPAIIQPAPKELLKPRLLRPVKQASILPGWFPAVVAAGGNRPRLEFLQGAVGTGIGTPITFTSQNLGAAADTRRIFVCVGANATGGPITSITVGGNACTLHFSNSGGNLRGAIGSILIPSGTSANVVVTATSGLTVASISMYRMTYDTGTPNNTPFDTDEFTQSNGSDPAPTLTLDVPLNGFILGSASFRLGTSITSITWTNLSEDYEAVLTGQVARHSTAHNELMAAETGRVITATVAGSGISSTTSTVFHALSWI